MATAKQLPSGSWRVRVYDNETKKYLSFTSSLPGKAGKKEAEFLAAEWQTGKKAKLTDTTKTVYEVVAEYIASKETVLSPSTIRGYYIIYRNALTLIGDKRIKALTEKDLQFWIAHNAQKYNAKTVKNQFGLVTAALHQERVQLDFDTISLPKIVRKEKNIPTEKEIGIILHMIEGTCVEIPITIAVTLGLRQSEIAALKWSDYNGETLSIHAAVVPDKNNKLVFKNTTKSAASTRTLEVGQLLKERLDRAERTSEFISPMFPSSVLRTFNRLCKENNLPKFTMHEQRHGNASMMLAMGVPDKYAMERLGQSSTNMIKDVYQHLYASKKKEVSESVDKAFSAIYDTKCDTNND